MVKLDSNNRKQYINIILDAINQSNKELFRMNFLELHPSDQSDILIRLDKDERKKVYSFITADEFADVFEVLNNKKQMEIFEELDVEYSSEVLNNMFTDNAVNFLTKVDNEKVEDLLLEMDPEMARELRVQLAYTEETAGAIMTKELISISSSDTAVNIIDHLRREAPDAEVIYYNYVVDEVGKLVGVVSLRDLIVAPPEMTIKDIMSTIVVSVPVDMDQEEVANIIKKYNFLAVPVVSKDGSLLGIVTVDDVMDILDEETTEDFGEISATRGATDINLGTFTAARKRAPWIIALMFFGLITANVIGRFEATLESVVLLAVFIPMIMDSAGNVGTQSLAVAVRGLALGTIEKGSFWKMIRREFTTGITLGLMCMALITVMIGVLYSGNWMLAIIVGFSLLCTLSVSTVIGSTVPLIINKLKLDPAIASGPFITTINDILGLLIYFSIATALMDYL